MKDIVKKLKEKTFYYKGFGFYYVDALTNENETIKGVSLYLFGKQCITIALSNVLWTKKDGKPYNFKIEDTVLFIRKIAIGFGSRWL